MSWYSSRDLGVTGGGEIMKKRHTEYCLWVDCSLWWWRYYSTLKAQIIYHVQLNWKADYGIQLFKEQGYYIQINKETEFMLYSWIKMTGLANHVWSGPSSGTVSMPWISKRRNLWWTFSAHGQHSHSDQKGRLCHLSKCLWLWGLCYARVISKCSFRTSLNQGLQCSPHSCVHIHTMHACAAKRTTFRSLFSFHMMGP